MPLALMQTEPSQIFVGLGQQSQVTEDVYMVCSPWKLPLFARPATCTLYIARRVPHMLPQKV